MRLQALTLEEVCTSLSILDDVGIVKVQGKRDMLKRTVSTHRVSYIFTIDFTVTFTLPHTGWGCYVTNPGLRLGL